MTHTLNSLNIFAIENRWKRGCRLNAVSARAETETGFRANAFYSLWTSASLTLLTCSLGKCLPSKYFLGAQNACSGYDWNGMGEPVASKVRMRCPVATHFHFFVARPLTSHQGVTDSSSLWHGHRATPVLDRSSKSDPSSLATKARLDQGTKRTKG